MSTAAEIVEELRKLGTAQTKKTWMNHGAQEPCFGVKIGDMKPIQKRIKKDYQLALDLYKTGISDAMYLAGLIADDDKMTKKDLQTWVKAASWRMICDYTVPWVAAQSRFGWEMGLEWIDSNKAGIASCGWSTLCGLVALKDDSELDLDVLAKLLARVEKTIFDQPDGVRYAMNSFVISVGGYVKPLSDLAIKTGKAIGKVEVDMGDTSCKVPDAVSYIQKMKDKNGIGKKRKTVKC